MTLPSAHHSPSTVNKKANEFVIGTVRLNSTHAKSASPFDQQRTLLIDSSRKPTQPTPPLLFHVPILIPYNNLFLFGPLPRPQKGKLSLTSPSNQQKKPHTPRQIHHKRQRIRRTPQKIHQRPKPLINSPLDPTTLITRIDTVQATVRRRVKVESSSTNEGGGETPGHAYKKEAEGPFQN